MSWLQHYPTESMVISSLTPFEAILSSVLAFSLGLYLLYDAKDIEKTADKYAQLLLAVSFLFMGFFCIFFFLFSSSMR